MSQNVHLFRAYSKNNQFTFNYNEPSSKLYKLKLSQFNVPMLWMNANFTMTIYFGASGSEILYTLRSGNYDTIDDLVNELKSVVHSGFYYDNVMKKIGFYSGTNFSMKNVSFYKLMGLNSATQTIALPALAYTMMPNQYDLRPEIMKINIQLSIPQSNLLIDTMNNKNNVITTIFATIPNNSSYGQVLLYEDQSEDYFVY